MKCKTLLSIIILVFSLSSCSYFFGVAKISKEIYEVWETKNSVFKIKIEAHKEEEGGFVPGAYFIFMSAPINTENWKEIMTFRHDDPIAIPKNQIKFVDEKMAYVFMSWTYAVTIDGGNNWSLWNAQESLKEWNLSNYRDLHQININLDGSGELVLESHVEEGKTLKLTTKDYGKHWSLNE